MARARRHAGGGQPSAREREARNLIALIHRVNPTGLDLPRAEMSRRYREKSQLQSDLIRRFQAELEATPAAAGTASLRHRGLDLDACHVVVDELDTDARDWLQGALAHHVPDQGNGAPPEAPGRGEPLFMAPQAEPPAGNLEAGLRALEAFDFPEAQAL